MSAPAPREPPDPRVDIGLAAAAVGLVILIVVTVVLQAPGATPALLAISVTSFGGNWRLGVTASSETLSTESVYFLTRTPSGDAFSPMTALVNLSAFNDLSPTGLLSLGDAVVLPQSQYRAGLTYWFLQADRLLAVGTLG